MKPHVLALAIVCLAAVLAAGGAVTPAAAQASGNASFVDVNASDLPGDGTESDPYEISNASELQAMNDSLDAHYELVDDVNASGTADWNDGDGFEPLGSGSTGFSGTLDGNGHAITSLTIDRSGSTSVGLFGVVGEAGTVEDLHLAGGNVTLADSDGSVGVVAGTNRGTLRNVSTDASVDATGSSDVPTVGGLVGTNEDAGVVRNATVDADVLGTIDVGGVVGLNAGEVANVHATGTVAGAGSDSQGNNQAIGGLVGTNDGGLVRDATSSAAVSGNSYVGGAVGTSVADTGPAPTVRNVTVTGSIAVVDPELGTPAAFGGVVGAAQGTVRNVTTAEGATIDLDANATQVGGVVGSAIAGQGTTATISRATSNVPVTGGNATGGVVGSIFGENATLTTAAATGDVDGTDGVGGLVGWNGGTVSDAYALGNASGSRFVGGLVGVNVMEEDGTRSFHGTVETAYAVGAVDGTSDVGGAVGRNASGTVTETYWNANTSDADDSAGGTALGTAEMQGSAATTNMDGFDFTDTWETVEDDSADGYGTGYPVLQDNTQAPAPVEGTLYADGDGEANPYEIETWHHLDNVRENLDAHFVLTNDLDESTAGYDEVAGESANGDAGFDPVGTDATPFTGSFDGQGHAVSNLTVDRPDTSPTGLIGALGEDGAVTTVTLVDATITGNDQVGALVGNNTGGTVSTASASGSVSGSDDVGGLVGRNDGLVAESDAAASVASDGGGVGGLVGGNIGGAISESYATGDVGSDGGGVGGLVGLSTSGTVNESYATGNVTGDAYVGGLVGDIRTNAGTDSVVERSYATGRVDGNTNVGGIVGGMVGAFSGATANLTDSYWDELGTNQTDAVGFPSYATIVENNTGYNTSDGQGRAAELTGDDAAGNMPALDFAETWETVPGEYPVLAWDVAPDQNPTPDPTPTPVPAPDPGEATDPPNAADDDYAVLANGTLSVTAENGTLANDADPDDLAASVASEPADGSLAFHANGSFAYDPDPGFVGNDSFTYEVSDGDGGADTATVTITVASDGSAPDVVIDGVDAPDRVAPGEAFEVTADVTNAGSGTGEANVAVAVDGETTESEQVELDPDATTTVALSATAPETAGNYSWTASLDDDARSGTIAVGTADGADGETDEGAADGDGLPGFGVLAAGLGVFGALAIGRRLGWQPANGHDSD